MRYYIPSLNLYVSDTQQFVVPMTREITIQVPTTIDGEEVFVPEQKVVTEPVTIPRRTLASRADEIGAIAAPVITSTQRLVEADGGWQIEDIPQAELDAAAATTIEAKVAQIWQERYEIANHPMYGLDPSGAVIIRELSNAGNTLAQEISAWVQALYDEAVAREAAVRAGDPIGEWSTSKEKPHSVNAAIAAGIP